MTPNRSVSPKAVAEAIGVSVDTIGRYAREGSIPFAATPKGHRRFDIDEVRDALSDLQGPSLVRLRRPATPTPSRLVAGPPVQVSAGSFLREQLRATRTAPATKSRPRPARGSTALDEVLGSARRVMVATAR